NAPAAGTLTFSTAQLLNGLNLTVDTTKLPNNTDVRLATGSWTGLDSGVNGGYGGATPWTGGGIELSYMNTGGIGASVTNAAPVAWNSGDNIGIHIPSPPIPEACGIGIVNLLNQNVQAPIRAGIIQAFAGSVTPDGWLDCDGTAYSQ